MSKEHKGLRYNTGKLRMDLVQPWAHEQMVKVLTKGAEKYADRNWERGMAWTTALASLKRHLLAYEKGEDYDPETGILHIAHVACNAHFLTAYYKLYPQGDDRQHDYLKGVRIGLDIDEVICDWLGGWTEKFSLDVPSNWYFDRSIIDRFDELREKNELDKFYLSLLPLVDPKDVPFEPHCYITSRPVDTHITEQWLDLHGFPARPVYTVGVGKTKVDIAKEQKLDIFVDDAFHNFKQLNEAGICCFLIDRPHNHRYNVGFKRIKDLAEIL